MNDDFINIADLMSKRNIWETVVLILVEHLVRRSNSLSIIKNFKIPYLVTTGTIKSL